jgi:antitoxin ParD1/3/4
MATRIAVNVSLTPQLNRFIAGLVKSGRYQSASEVVREGLRTLRERQRRESAVAADLRRKIKEGLDAVARGDTHDGRAFFRELEREERRPRRRAS